MTLRASHLPADDLGQCDGIQLPNAQPSLFLHIPTRCEGARARPDLKEKTEHDFKIMHFVTRERWDFLMTDIMSIDKVLR